ncbi:alpha/beta fold hydrolase [Pengzhenrongella phosphoraccumulans]|uniref:alpha/beta fold hydrolase n=1 Tax=Pengzhenrongella phosphoraccumulans TaxID=3114394 RepID=UPI00388D5F6C
MDTSRTPDRVGSADAGPTTQPAPQYLSRPEGRISYTVQGAGPVVVLVPGMGDLRSTWRELVGPLVTAGYRVAVTDLRGHGDSDTTFSRYGDIATGEDLIALVRELGDEPAVLIGNSMGASAAIWAAAERPDRVAGLVLVSPFLREPKQVPGMAGLLRLVYRLLFARPWGASAWASYYRRVLSKGATAPWLDEHVADLRTSLRRAGYLRAFRRLTLQLTHKPVEERLAEVRAPAVAFVGELDPDFADPAAELAWIVEALDARGVAVPDAAHYPQHQAPALVLPIVLEHLAGLRRTTGPAARWDL